MKVVKTFTQQDFDALVAAGMDYQQEPINSFTNRWITCIQFAINDEIYDKLDLDNRFDITIQTSDLEVVKLV